MKKITLIFAGLLTLFSTLYAQSPEEMEKMEAAWEASMKVGDEHKFLQKMEGNWTYTSTNFMNPTQPEVSEGKAKKEIILGGRYLQEINNGTTFGMPFEGRNLYAYDNILRKYRTIWIDNLGTGFMIGEGTREGQTLTTYSTYPDIMGGPDQIYKIVYTVKSSEEHSMEMLMATPEGEYVKQMSNLYKKVK